MSRVANVTANREAREAAFAVVVRRNPDLLHHRSTFEHGWDDGRHGYSDFARRHYSGNARIAYSAGRKAATRQP